MRVNNTSLAVRRRVLRSLGPPGAWLPAVGALGTAFGLAVAIYCIVFPSILKPLPYPDADRIVTFLLTSASGSGPQASEAQFNVWRSQESLFEHVAGFRRVIMKLDRGGDPRDITVGRVGASFFPLFGASATAGRLFVEPDEQPPAQLTVVLSHGLWSRSFHADPGVIGTAISLDRKSYLVIGVLDPQFDAEEFNPSGAAYSGGQPQAWVPFYIDQASTDRASYFTAFARLRPAVPLSTARAALDVLATQFRAAHPDLGPHDGFTVDKYAKVAIAGALIRLYVLIGAAAFVMLIGYINAANLAAVRAVALTRELQVRAALGASRAQQVLPIMREHLGVGALSVMVGLFLGTSISRIVIAVDGGAIPRISSNGPPPWLYTIGFAVSLGLVAAAVTAGVALVSVARGGPLAALLARAGQGASLRIGPTRALSIALQTAASVVLLYGTTVLVGTFIALHAINAGFDTSNVMTMRMSFSGPRFAATADLARALQDGAAAVSAIAGVDRVGATCCLPLDRSLNLPFVIVDRPLTSMAHGTAGWVSASESFFEVLRIPIVLGRSFTMSDAGPTSPVVIINKTMADSHWPNGDAIGQRLIIGGGVGPEFIDTARQIIGIVGDVRDVSLEQPPRPIVYLPTAQLPDPLNALVNRQVTQQWVIRTRGDSPPIQEIETALRKVTGQDVVRSRTMGDVLWQSTAARDSNTLVMSLFGTAALILAVVGVYGVVSYSVAQRQRETAIRMALGEQTNQVRRRILREGLMFWTAGLVIGLAGSVAMERVFQRLVFGVATTDLRIFVTVAAVVGVVGLASVWHPASRASRCDLASALRAL